MDLLDEIYFDNSLRSYLVVLGTILFVLLFKRYFSKYIASLLYLFVKNTWKNIEKRDFVALLTKPLSWFITISISVFAIDKLNFPEAFIFKIYGHSSDEILQKIGICLIILFFLRFVISLINFIALIFEQKAKLTKDKRDDQLIIFFRDFLKAIVAIFGILFLIKVGFNQNIGTVITGLSIVGAALALAAKESLENLIASFVIFFDKPFFTGDILKVNNVTGTVERIGLRSTRIRTFEKTLITVPNKQMVDSVVDNLSMRNQRRGEIKLEFSPKSSTHDIEALITEAKKILSADPDRIMQQSVFLTDYNKNGATVTVEFFSINCSMSEFNGIKQSINISIKALVENLKLEMTSAGNDINIFNGENPSTPKNQSII